MHQTRVLRTLCAPAVTAVTPTNLNPPAAQLRMIGQLIKATPATLTVLHVFADSEGFGLRQPFGKQSFERLVGQASLHGFAPRQEKGTGPVILEVLSALPVTVAPSHPGHYRPPIPEPPPTTA